ncbi:MAG: WD40/YVTN/BNR-like repeat-containing protein, partial [Solimonas sp.]
LDIARAGERAVAVGDRGDIVVSDNGRDWRQVESPVDAMLTRVFFLDAKRGWAVGHDGAIVHTEDGGLHWAVQHWVPDRGPLYDVLFLDAQKGFAVGSYAVLLRTDDGGKNWNPVEADIRNTGLHFNAITRLADGTLFIAGERGILARSADGGTSWTMLDSPYRGSMFGALPMGEHGVLIYGLRGTIYAADDVRTARTVAVEGWDEFDRETVTDAAAVAAMGWRRIDNPSHESLFRGLPHDGGALLTGVNGVVLNVPAGAAGGVRALANAENESLSGLLLFDGKWLAVGRRGVRPLPIELAGPSGEHP